MPRDNLSEALELGAVETTCCRNGWWKVSFADLELASFFKQYALDEGWTVIGGNLVLGVRPTP